MATCVICLGSNPPLSDRKDNYNCQCRGVLFHEGCWNTYHNRGGDKCPFCRNECISATTIRIDIIPDPNVPNQLPSPQQQPSHQQLLSQQPPHQPPPSPPQPHFTIMKSRFITEHPCVNLFFCVFLIGYSGGTAGLLTYGLIQDYDRLNNLIKFYGIMFAVFNVYDVLSVFIDQWFGVVYMVQKFLATRRHCIMWLGCFYILMAGRIFLSLSCVIVKPLLESNGFIESGVIFVLLQGLGIGSAVCFAWCNRTGGRCRR